MGQCSSTCDITSIASHRQKRRRRLGGVKRSRAGRSEQRGGIAGRTHRKHKSKLKEDEGRNALWESQDWAVHRNGPQVLVQEACRALKRRHRSCRGVSGGKTEGEDVCKGRAEQCFEGVHRAEVTYTPLRPGGGEQCYGIPQSQVSTRRPHGSESSMLGSSSASKFGVKDAGRPSSAECHCTPARGSKASR